MLRFQTTLAYFSIFQPKLKFSLKEVCMFERLSQVVAKVLL
jgi:hypothetical protein